MLNYRRIPHFLTDSIPKPAAASPLLPLFACLFPVPTHHSHLRGHSFSTFFPMKPGEFLQPFGSLGPSLPVGGIPTPLKNMSLSAGIMTFPIYGKSKKNMFQTTVSSLA